MISLMLYWHILALLYMCPGTIAHLVSTQINGKKFEIVKGFRYGGGELTTLTARSMGECAIMCVNDKSCSKFNFGSGQCEMLSAAASCRTNAAGWTHGYYPKGKYQTSNRERPQLRGKEIYTLNVDNWVFVLLCLCTFYLQCISVKTMNVCIKGLEKAWH